MLVRLTRTLARVSDARARSATAFLTVMMVLGGVGAAAQSPGGGLAQLSLEELMNIEITSASRRSQPLSQVAGAVYVLSSDDIRRSGMTTIPDLLRLVPGVHVAQIDADSWAVSMRGFNSEWSNKLLVLVDGRSVYNRLYSGVYWRAVDLPLDDIDRIEVVRGSGGAVWGANAVNGVVNIVTKTAAVSHGTTVSVRGGNLGNIAGAMRHGGRTGATHYRVSTQWDERGEARLALGVPGTSFGRGTAGLRLDRASGGGAWMLDAGLTMGRAPDLVSFYTSPSPGTRTTVLSDEQFFAAHLVGGWSYKTAAGDAIDVTPAVDTRRSRFTTYVARHQQVGVEGKYTRSRDRHTLVTGLSVRGGVDSFDGVYTLPDTSVTMSVAEEAYRLFGAFAQDEIALAGQRLRITIGAKTEHDTYVGWNVQPTVRALWNLSADQHLWAASSSAVRTPSMSERRIKAQRLVIAQMPVLAEFSGDPAFPTQRYSSIETGYRAVMFGRVAVDVAGYYGRHRNQSTSDLLDTSLRTQPTPHVAQTYLFGHGTTTTASGVEAGAQVSPMPAWVVTGAYTFFSRRDQIADPAQASPSTSADGTPAHQWVLRSSFDRIRNIALGVTLIRTGRVAPTSTPAWTRLDARLEWRRGPVSIAGVGQNLVQSQHFEFMTAGTGRPVPRRAAIELSWSFARNDDGR